MNENLRWLAINAPDWNNNLDRIARGQLVLIGLALRAFRGELASAGRS